MTGVEDESIFYPVFGYEDYYEINKVGLVRSFPRPYSDTRGNVGVKKARTLATCKTKSGYRYVGLCGSDGIQMHCRVHRLLAKTFLPNPLNLPSVNHINGIKHDNRLSNLEWISHSDNNKHSFLVLGQIIHNRKLTKEDVEDIYYNTKISRGKVKRQGTLSMQEMADKYSVTTRTINNIILKRVYIDIVSNFEDIDYDSSYARLDTDKLKKRKLKGNLEATT